MSGTAMRRGRREWVLDALLWAVLVAPITFALLTDPALGRLAVALIVMAAAVALCRSRPLVSLIIVVLASLVDGNFSFSIPVMSYLVGLRDDRVRPVVTAFTVIMIGGSLVSLGVLNTDPSQWFLLVTTLLFAGVFPWLVGRYRTQQQRLVVAGWERAEQLERERLIVTEQARLRERTRIAEELHDSLGHELSLIALRAAALEVAADLSEAHRAAAGRIRQDAASATDRLHDSVGLLRGAGAAPLDPPSESVDQLATRARASGMTVSLRCTGDPAAMPELVARTAHRVVQESLTNATRHAPGAAVQVTIVHDAASTTVTIDNAATATTARPGGARGGFGLVGLHERVRLTGGAFSAGTHPGGFRVSARLPHDGSAGADRSTGAELAGPADGVLPSGGGAASDAGAPAVQLRAGQLRVRRSLVVAFVAPVVVAGIMAVSYYPFATFNAVLESGDFDQIRVGASRAELAPVLPARQARPRLVSGVSAVPGGASCEFYSDGNFPFAQATYRLCFVGDLLVTRDNLRDKDDVQQ